MVFEQLLAPLVLAQVHQAITPQVALERLFTSSQLRSEWFADTFLAQVPASQVKEIINKLRSQLGSYLRVQPSSKDYLVVFQHGSVPTQIVLNNQGQIAGLFFRNPQANFLSLNAAVEAFKALPGQASLLVLAANANKEEAALNPDKPLAVGSAFKLAVLKALKGQIASGQRSWADVVNLNSHWKSLPTGILQGWPDGSLLTLQTLAALMISQSDNTATDALINLVGRQEVERFLPHSRPLLTTREAFILKSTRNAELLRRYRANDETKRRLLLNEIANYPLPEVSEFTGNPVALDVEWFLTTRELCTLMPQVAELPLMSINPGIANPKEWQHIAFKGGSEPGVMNLTTWLQAKNGKTYCVSATWNDSASLDETRFITLYGGVLSLLK